MLTVSLQELSDDCQLFGRLLLQLHVTLRNITGCGQLVHRHFWAALRMHRPWNRQRPAMQKSTLLLQGFSATLRLWWTLLCYFES